MVALHRRPNTTGLHTAEGLEGNSPTEMEVKRCRLRSDVIFDVLLFQDKALQQVAIFH